MKYDHIKPKERLQFESDNKIDWHDLFITFLFGILFIGLLLLCYAPFTWR
jgi:hypothetical protein